MKHVHLIRTDGTESDTTVSRWAELAPLIGADVLCTVNLRDGRVMLADDLGYETETIEHGPGRYELRPTKARKPVNPKATALYHGICRPGTTHAIVGDVAIVVDAEWGDA